MSEPVRGFFVCVYLAAEGMPSHVEIDVFNGSKGVCRCGCAYSVGTAKEVGQLLPADKMIICLESQNGAREIINGLFVIHDQKGPGDRLFEESYDFALR